MGFVLGVDSINNTVHRAKTDSIGFCFLSGDDYTIAEASEFLSGITTMDVVLVAEVKELPEHFVEGYGEYRDFKADNLSIMELMEQTAKMIAGEKVDLPSMKIKEYSTKWYNIDMFDRWEIYAPKIRKPGLEGYISSADYQDGKYQLVASIENEE